MLTWNGFPVPFLNTHLASIAPTPGLDDIAVPAFLERAEIPNWVAARIEEAMRDPAARDAFADLRQWAQHIRTESQHDGQFAIVDRVQVEQSWQLLLRCWSDPTWRVPLILMPSFWFYVTSEREDVTPLDFVPAHFGEGSAGLSAKPSGWQATVLPSYLPPFSAGIDGDPTTYAVLTVDLDHATDVDVLAALACAREHTRRSGAGRPSIDRTRIKHVLVGLISALYTDERPPHFEDALWLLTAEGFATWIESGSTDKAFVAGVQRHFEHRYNEHASASSVRRVAKLTRELGVPASLVGRDAWRNEGAFARLVK